MNIILLFMLGGKKTLDSGDLVKSITFFHNIQKTKANHPPKPYWQKQRVVYQYIVVQQVSQPAGTYINQPQEGSNSFDRLEQSRIINIHGTYLHFDKDRDTNKLCECVSFI